MGFGTAACGSGLKSLARSLYLHINTALLGWARAGHALSRTCLLIVLWLQLASSGALAVVLPCERHTKAPNAAARAGPVAAWHLYMASV